MVSNEVPGIARLVGDAAAESYKNNDDSFSRHHLYMNGVARWKSLLQLVRAAVHMISVLLR